MTWRWSGDKPLSEQWWLDYRPHIGITRLHWANDELIIIDQSIDDNVLVLDQFVSTPMYGGFGEYIPYIFISYQ